MVRSSRNFLQHSSLRWTAPPFSEGTVSFFLNRFFSNVIVSQKNQSDEMAYSQEKNQETQILWHGCQLFIQNKLILMLHSVEESLIIVNDQVSISIYGQMHEKVENVQN